MQRIKHISIGFEDISTFYKSGTSIFCVVMNIVCFEVAMMFIKYILLSDTDTFPPFSFRRVHFSLVRDLEILTFNACFNRIVHQFLCK